MKPNQLSNPSTDPLLTRLAELQAALELVTRERDETAARLTTAEATIRDARFVLAGAFQEGQPPLDCPRLRELARRTFAVLRRVP